MNNIKKSLISILVCSIVFSLWGQPVFAEEYYNTTGYFDRLLLGIVHGTSSIPLVGDAVQGIAGGLVGDICSGSDDGLHHATEFVDGTLHQKDGLNYALGICLYCGKRFEIYGADVKTAYDNYVETLPATGYTSTGGLIWYPTWKDWWFDDRTALCSFFENVTPDPLSRSCNGSLKFSWSSVSLRVDLKIPFNGLYRTYEGFRYDYRYVDNNGQIVSKVAVEQGPFEWKRQSAGNLFSSTNLTVSAVSSAYISGTFTLPAFEALPDTVVDKDTTYSTTTRPTSITGGNYGIVGDNGQITKVEDNSTIVNETNNTFYNPATGTTVPIVNWSYDYSDRSYKVTLESGDTATVTYGDENITISQITTTEGDTITNNYTIYYLVDGSGSVTPPCDHDWQASDGTLPTCTRPGSASYVCSKCQQTKKDPLPALGHDWQVKQTVITEYDDTGQLVQQGYTIFECSRCHEQYKSSDGTIPPGGGSSTDPGGDEGETIWDKLGKLLGTAVKALLDLLGSAVDVILGGLIDLITNLVESLKQLVDLFGTVGEAFQVLWTWLPPEITAILVAGVSIFVFVALLKFFMK